MESGSDCHCHWDILDEENPQKLNLGSYAFFVLNTAINRDCRSLVNLWNGDIAVCLSPAKYRVTVDGGTDRWFSHLEKNNHQRLYPDLVSGDFDSILPQTLDEVKKKGVKTVYTEDQDHTDFTKAVKAFKECCPTEVDTLLVLSGVSGRLDQLFSLLNTLAEIPSLTGKERMKTYLLGENSLTWLLRKGTHVITIPSRLRAASEWCSILPFAPTTTNQISTTGLKWNLNKNSVEFGGLISSSNTYNGEPDVTLQTDADILWSMGLGLELGSNSNG